MSLSTGGDRGAPSSYRPAVSVSEQQERNAGVDLVCRLLHAKTNCNLTLVPHTEIAVERSSGAIEAWSICARMGTGNFLACTFDGGTLKAWKLLSRDDVQNLNPGFTEPRGGSWVRPDVLRDEPSVREVREETASMPHVRRTDFSHYHSPEGRTALIQLVAPRVVALLHSKFPNVIDVVSHPEAKGAMDRELARAALAYSRSIGRSLKGHVSELEIMERVGGEYNELFRDLTKCVRRAFIEQRISECHRHGSILHTAFDALGKQVATELNNRARGPFGMDRGVRPEVFQSMTENHLQRIERAYPGFIQARESMGYQSFARHLSFALGRHVDTNAIPAWASWSLRSGQPRMQ